MRTLPYITTKLQPLKSYPTYQFHTEIIANRLNVSDAFKIFILETFRWLRSRLKAFENLPSDIQTPEPDDFLNFSDNELHSFGFTNGLSVDVIYIERKGIWSFLLSEIDMGANIGTDTERLPVNGRMFNTEISFRKQQNSVEMGVRTICSEPSDCDTDCEVFRPTVVKAIAENPNIGFRQNGFILDGNPLVISSRTTLEHFCNIWNADGFNLPIVVIADSGYTISEPKKIESLINNTVSYNYGSGDLFNKTNVFNLEVDIKKLNLKPQLTKIRPKKAPIKKDTNKLDTIITPEKRQLPALEYLKLSKSLIGFALVCFVDENYFKPLENKTHITLNHGDVMVLGYKTEFERYSYKQYSNEIDSFYKKLKDDVKQLPKRRAHSFGNIIFHSDAKLQEYHVKRHETLSLEDQCTIFHLENEELKKQIKNYSQENTDMQLTTETLRITQKQLRSVQDELDSLQALYKESQKTMVAKENSYRRSAELISFYQARVDIAATYPHTQSEVCEWIEENFSQQILVASRARSEMRKYCSALDISILCDGILYLDAYAKFRRQEITAETFSLYSNRNGWNVEGCGKETLRVHRDDYTTSHNGKRYLLDMHIKHGISTSMLIRIYFCWDEQLQKIVIGSMPEHLSTIKNST